MGKQQQSFSDSSTRAVFIVTTGKGTAVLVDAMLSVSSGIPSAFLILINLHEM